MKADVVANSLDKKIPNKNEHLFLDIGQVIIKNSTSRRIEQVQIYFKWVAMVQI